MSVNPTSIQSGFARSRSEALFARLFPDLGWWCPSLQSPGGSRLHDLSGRQNWGTLTNMTNDDWVNVFGRPALDFDGSNDYVDNVGYAPATVERSLSGWFKYPGSGTIAMLYSAGENNLNQGFSIYLNGNSTITMSQWGSSVSGGSTFNTNLWTHFCMVNYGNAWEIWINGRLLNSGTMTTTPTRHKGRMGAQNITPLYSFLGQLDDYRLYSRALKSGDTRQLYQLGRGNMPRIRQRRYSVEEAGFKAYWANRRSRIIGAGI
jgi:hypothetical protein